MLKKMLSTCCALLCVAALFCQVPATEECYKILDDIYNSFNFDEAFTCNVSIITEKPNRPKDAAQYKLFRRDRQDKTCIVQIAPEVDKGVGYLQEKENFWAYDPISHQFTHSSIKRNLGDSNAKISDVNKQSEFKKTWEITAVEESMLGKFEVIIVTAKSLDKDFSYSQQKYFIRKEPHLILKIESYGASGRHMRTTLIPKYAKVNGRPFPMQQIYVNELVKEEKTTQILSDFEIAKIPDVVFTKAYLEKIN